MASGMFGRTLELSTESKGPRRRQENRSIHGNPTLHKGSQSLLRPIYLRRGRSEVSAGTEDVRKECVRSSPRRETVGAINPRTAFTLAARVAAERADRAVCDIE